MLIGIFTFQVSFLSVGSAQEFMFPSDVENLKAEAKDSSIKLSWDKASDSDGVILGYKIYYGTNSVKTVEDEYADEILTRSTDLNYEIFNLINGVQYYFSVTAIDDEENESENYSIEVSAMPFSTNPDNPSVVSAEQKSFTEIEVIMSKEVTVKSLTNSFFIKEKLNPTSYLDVKNTKLNGEKVTLVVDENLLKPNFHYIVTATSTVEDYFGNPVSSGITDSVEFISKSKEVMEAIIKEKEAKLKELEMPEEEEVFMPEAPVLEEEVIFGPESPVSEEEVVFMPEIPEVIDPVSGTEEVSSPFIEEGEEDSEESTFASEENIELLEEENLEEEVHSTAFVQDKTPPLSVQEVKVDQSTFEKEGFVSVDWVPALDVDEDIVDQIIYTKEEGGDWDEGYSVGKETKSIELEIDENKNYEVKIVTLDSSSNKTEGEILNFSTKLIKSGSGTVISFIFAFILSGFYFVSRRRVC